MIIAGKAHKFGDFINTDIHCSSKYAGPDTTRQQLLDQLFTELKPGFPHQVKPGDLIVAGKSFGTVSTREEAPELLRQLGIGAVLAESFGYLFYRNAINLGLPVIECDTDPIQDGDEIVLDLEKMTAVIRQGAVPLLLRTSYSRQVYEILMDGGLLAHLKKHRGYKNVSNERGQEHKP